MRKIAVVTTSRADYNIYLPVLRQIQSHPDLQLDLLVSGLHLSPEFGFTVEMIEADGFHIAQRIESLISSDRPEGTAKSMGLATLGFGQLFAHYRPDILLVLGDRFEMHAATLAALPFRIPIAHIHGGELTFGAIDDALRHSMSKLSHIHFVTTARYGQRIVQLGEHPRRVIVSGAPSLDNLKDVHLMTLKELSESLEIPLERDFLLVTYHPVSLEFEQTERQISQLLLALEQIERLTLFTMANADAGGHLINHHITEFVATNPKCFLVKNLGLQRYFSAMSLASAMVGNSSSGIIEAASFKLPVVNIGHRQEGRVHSKNVIQCGHEEQEIISAVKKATSDAFRAELSDLVNPYGDGHAAKKIVGYLATVSLDDDLLKKRFYDLPSATR